MLFMLWHVQRTHYGPIHVCLVMLFTTVGPDVLGSHCQNLLLTSNGIQGFLLCNSHLGSCQCKNGLLDNNGLGSHYCNRNNNLCDVSRTPLECQYTPMNTLFSLVLILWTFALSNCQTTCLLISLLILFRNMPRLSLAFLNHQGVQ
jgi:hypothetical protein